MSRALLTTAVLLLSSCTREQWHRFPSPDDLVALVGWFATMHQPVALQPYAFRPRPPVPGTVPVTGAEPELVIMDDNLPAINRIGNPVARTAESLDRGKELFGIYCYPCHGPLGAGDGPVTPVFIRPPPLTRPEALQYTDGYLYTLIRQGRGIMPRYGDKVFGADRWHLVNYIRLLQETP